MKRLRLADVEAARRAIAPYLPPTPLRRAFSVANEAYLKLECWQPTGSFKVRGALHALLRLAPGEADRGVVAASAGNHALGVAFAASLLGGRVRVRLFVPETAPRAKLDKLRTFPVDLQVGGATYDDAYDRAMQAVEKDGSTYVHAFEDDRTAAGQGTVALEILEQRPDVGTVLVPVGGGGLISSMAAALDERRPEVRVIAVQPEASPALRESLRRGEPMLRYPAEPTIADGLSGGIGEITWRHRDLVDEVVTVSEAEIEDAVAALVAQDQVVAEGSGAVGVAALRSGRVTPSSFGSTVVVVTGANIDPAVLARILRDRY